MRAVLGSEGDRPAKEGRGEQRKTVELRTKGVWRPGGFKNASIWWIARTEDGVMAEVLREKDSLGLRIAYLKFKKLSKLGRFKPPPPSAMALSGDSSLQRRLDKLVLENRSLKTTKRKLKW